MYLHSLSLSVLPLTLLPPSTSTFSTSFEPSQKDLTLQNTERTLMWGFSMHSHQGLTAMLAFPLDPDTKETIRNNKMEDISSMKQSCVNFTRLLAKGNVPNLTLVLLLSLLAVSLASLF